jgi:ABC-type Fe3+ transport system substrate-binding protein
MMHLGRRYAFVTLWSCLAVAALCWPARILATESKSTNELKIFHAASGPAATLSINGTADIAAIGPVIEAFQQEHPDVEIRYRLYETASLYLDALADSNNKPSADLLISSAMDLQVKLANDGYAQQASVGTQGLPNWAIWRNEIFAFTLEPAVIVYNKDILQPADVPRSHRDLIRLLERSPEQFRGRLATYDIAVSGVGYLIATTESMLSANFWRLTHALGVVETKLFCCSQDMLDSLVRGETILAYDVLGSYALKQLELHPNIGIILPEDYVVAVSRTMVIPRAAQHPGLAQQFVDYALSEDGQAVVARAFGLSISGLDSHREQMKERYVAEKPGLLSFPALGLPSLTYLDAIKRRQFVRTWQKIVGR